MKIKILVLMLFCLILLTACEDAGSGSLSVYNWGDYIGEDVIGEFEAKTGIKVTYNTYESNEEMYIKLKQANSPLYDIIIPSDYMIERMIKEDMLEELNFGNIPNYANVDERFMGLPFDEDNHHYVPYMWGTLGILYNTKMVQGEITSWDSLWDLAYKGKIYMYDSSRDTFAVAFKKLGLSFNNTDPMELDRAKHELRLQQDYELVVDYLTDEAKDRLVAGEGAMAVTFSGDAIVAMRENSGLAFVVPDEGSNIWVDGMVIPKGAKNKENAEKFINFLCDAEIARQNTEHIGYSTTNKAAFELLPAELRQDPVYWPGDDILANCEMYHDLGKFVQQYDIAWSEVVDPEVSMGFWYGMAATGTITLLYVLVCWLIPPKKRETEEA